MRTEVAIVGKTNVGKSSLINFLTNQDLSIVSKTSGTTTDPVRKLIELRDIGPCVLIDTAGLDDDSPLGILRTSKTNKVLNESDIILVVTCGDSLSDFEKELFVKLKNIKLPFIVLHNKNDEYLLSDATINYLTENKIDYLSFSLTNKTLNVESLRKLIFNNLKIESPTTLEKLVTPSDLVMLVTPIDIAAPKNRLILPQVQTIRQIIDQHAIAVVLDTSEINSFLKLKITPKLVITDSQAFKQVDALIPSNINLTSFSILLSYLSGNISTYLSSIDAIKKLTDHDEILIMESCTHHHSSVDIGKVQIPKLLTKTTKKDLKFTFTNSKDEVFDLSRYKLAIQCGGCMLTHTQLKRIVRTINQTTPITNYGLVISYCLGILDRAILPFRNLYV